MIAPEALAKFNSVKEILSHGHKFIACGCRDGDLIYQLWCATGETYELKVQPLTESNFKIIDIQEADFPQP